MVLAVAETGDPVRVQLWSLLVGVILPILVGLATKVTTSASTKAVALAFLSAVSGFVSEMLDSGDSFRWSTALITWAATFIVAVAVHFGLWKPTGASGAAQKVGVR
ncbi:hypothetical protein [Embleya sp. NPDC001921]